MAQRSSWMSKNLNDAIVLLVLQSLHLKQLESCHLKAFWCMFGKNQLPPSIFWCLNSVHFADSYNIIFHDFHKGDILTDSWLGAGWLNFDILIYEECMPFAQPTIDNFLNSGYRYVSQPNHELQLNQTITFFCFNLR